MRSRKRFRDRCPDPAVRVGCLRRRATGVPEEWPSRAAHVAKAAGAAPYRTRLTGRLISERARWDDRRALARFGAASQCIGTVAMRCPSVRPRESGNPTYASVLGTNQAAVVPAKALGHAHILRAARRASPLPSPCELLRAVGRGRGWGVLFRPSTWLNRDSWHVPYPARHLRRRVGLEVGKRFRSNTADPRGPPPPTPPHHSASLRGGRGAERPVVWPSKDVCMPWREGGDP